MNLTDVLLHPDEYDGSTVAAPWTWLLGNDFEVLHVTVFGNFVLIDKLGRIWLLDSWAGQLHGISESYEIYQDEVATNEDFFRSWFLADFVEELLASGCRRSSGFVFGSFVSPALGGSLSKDNFSLAPLKAYVATAANEAQKVISRE